MIKAFAQLVHAGATAHYVIVVGGPLEQGVRAQLAAEGLVDSVTLITDYLSAAELRDLYHAATALVFCSLSEGQGRTPVEAMACGTPVVGSDLGPIPEVVEHAVTGLLVDPFSPKAIAGAMNRFASERGFAGSMGDACVASARRFDMDTINPQEAALYRRVLRLSGS